VQQGKGQRDRYATLSPRLLQVLRAWWRAARPTEWLFPSGPAGRHLTPATLQEACHKAAHWAGIRKHITDLTPAFPMPQFPTAAKQTQ
jgi:integrase/recombinase XerD